MNQTLYLICTLMLSDLADLGMNGSIPDDWKFRVKNGRVLYDEVGSCWRETSDNTDYLCHKDASYTKYRYMPYDTMIEIVRVPEEMA
jgi:hypothetical protein